MKTILEKGTEFYFFKDEEPLLYKVIEIRMVLGDFGAYDVYLYYLNEKQEEHHSPMWVILDLFKRGDFSLTKDCKIAKFMRTKHNGMQTLPPTEPSSNH